MDEKSRVAKAFKGMKSIGIGAQAVKPVLKRLLNLYGDMEFIELDNYRVLVDAIFEDEANDEHREPLIKKQRRIFDEGRATSLRRNGKDVVDFKDDILGNLVDEIENEGGSLPIDPGTSSANHQQTGHRTICDLATSTCGKAKISLKCDHSLQQKSIYIACATEFLKNAEKQCTFSVNSGDQFCVARLLKEICECYLSLGHKAAGDGEILNAADCIEDDTEKMVLADSRLPVSCATGKTAQLQVSSTQKKKVFHRINDIAKGTEKVKISLLDEVGNTNLPDFTYIPVNIIYEYAYVCFSLARIAYEDCCSGCKGDCLTSLIPCACSRETGGEFAYTSEGLLKEKFLQHWTSMKLSLETQYIHYCQDCPLERAKSSKSPKKCKGHFLRKFIKECWSKCGCSMQCGNRVVQRGITRKLQVFLTSENKGWGLRTLEELPKGSFVCEYVGEILTNIELYERNNKSSSQDKHTYPVLLDADWATEGVLKDEDALCLDATRYGNVARFINHRCFDGNLIEIPVEVETPDRHYYHLAFFTQRKVKAFEELTWDYSIDFEDKEHPIEAFRCNCGSQYCRDKRYN